MRSAQVSSGCPCLFSSSMPRLSAPSFLSGEVRVSASRHLPKSSNSSSPDPDVPFALAEDPVAEEAAPHLLQVHRPWAAPLDGSGEQNRSFKSKKKSLQFRSAPEYLKGRQPAARCFQGLPDVQGDLRGENIVSPLYFSFFF